MRVDLGGEGRLGLVLHAAVDREDEVVAGAARVDLALALGDRAAVGSRSTTSSPGSPVRSVVVLQLEAGAADAVDVDAAEDAARPRSPAGLKRAGSSSR